MTRSADFGGKKKKKSSMRKENSGCGLAGHLTERHTLSVGRLPGAVVMGTMAVAGLGSSSSSPPA